MMLPFVGVYVALIIQGLPDLTEPEVGANEIIVPPLLVEIHEGRDELSVNVMAVTDPVVAHEPTVQERIAGLEV